MRIAKAGILSIFAVIVLKCNKSSTPNDPADPSLLLHLTIKNSVADTSIYLFPINPENVTA